MKCTILLLLLLVAVAEGIWWGVIQPLKGFGIKEVIDAIEKEEDQKNPKEKEYVEKIKSKISHCKNNCAKEKCGQESFSRKCVTKEYGTYEEFANAKCKDDCLARLYDYLTKGCGSGSKCEDDENCEEDSESEKGYKCIRKVCSDPGWVTRGKSCYLANKTSMTWPEAKEFCTRKGGYLAEIESSEEQKQVAEILDNGKQTDYWIGLYKSKSNVWLQDNWVWQHSKNQKDWDSWFYPSEPSDKRVRDEDGKLHFRRCVAMSLNSERKRVENDDRVGWYDYWCEQLPKQGNELPIFALCESSADNLL